MRIWIVDFAFCLVLTLNRLAFGGFEIFYITLAMSRLASFSLPIGFLTSFYARFTPIFKAIFSSSLFGKFRQRLGLLAFGTSFRYDFCSHNFLSLQKNVLVRAVRPTCSGVRLVL